MGTPVIFLASGTKTWSYNGSKMNMNSKGITGSEGAGTLKPRILGFKVVLCWTENV